MDTQNSGGPTLIAAGLSQGLYQLCFLFRIYGSAGIGGYALRRCFGFECRLQLGRQVLNFNPSRLGDQKGILQRTDDLSLIVFQNGGLLDGIQINAALFCHNATFIADTLADKLPTPLLLGGRSQASQSNIVHGDPINSFSENPLMQAMAALTIKMRPSVSTTI